MDEISGKHDGQVKGHRYFQCGDNHGVFTKLNRVFREPMRSPQMSEIDGPSSRVGATPSRFQSPGPSLPSTLASPVERTPSPFGGKSGGMQVGERVIVSSATGGTKMGILKYLGPTDFAAGQWCGVELDKGHPGKNDGSVGGKRYFTCEDGRGLFVPISKVVSSPLNRSLRRHGSRESLASISSLASSVASRTTRRVSSQRHQCLPTCSMQAVLKEKENHVEHLLKERELDRIEMANVTRKCEEFAQELRTARDLADKNKTETESNISKLQIALEEERRKYEDLQYSLDEERISKSELASQLETVGKRASNDQTNLSEIDRLNATIEASNGNIKDLKEALDTKSKEAATLEASLVTLRNDNEQLKLTLSKVESGLKYHEELVNESQGGIEQLKALLQEQEVSEQELKRKVEELGSHHSDAKAQISKLETSVTQLEKQKSDLQAEISDLVKSKDSSSEHLSKKLEASFQEVSELRNKVDALSKESSEYKATISTMEEEKFQFSGQLDRMKTAITDLEDTLSKKKQEVLANQEKHQAVLADLQKTSEAKLNALTEQLKNGSLQSSEAHSLLEEVRKQKEKLLADNVLLGKEKGELGTELQKIQSELEISQKNIQILEKRFEENQKAHVMEYDTVLAENQSLTKRCNELKENVAVLEADVQKTSSQQSCTASELSLKEKQIGDLTTSLESLKKRCEELEAQNRQKAQNLVDMEDSMQRKKNESDELVSQIKALELKIYELEQEILKLRERADTADNLAVQLTKAAETSKAQTQTKQEEVIEAQKALSARAEEITKLEDDLKSLNASKIQLEKKLLEDSKEREKLKDSSTRLSEDYDALSQVIADRDDTILSRERDLEQLRKQFHQACTELQDKTVKLEGLEVLLKKKLADEKEGHQEVALKADRIGELEQSLAQMKSHTDFLEKKINEKNKSIAEYQAKLDKAAATPVDEESQDKDRQINFLNSIIVDLQNKNQELTTKVDVLLHGSAVGSPTKRLVKTKAIRSSNDNLCSMKLKLETKMILCNSYELIFVCFHFSSTTQNAVTLRLYCDICEKFDVHDTEDCPTQSSETPPQAHREKQPAADRPYCDSCESKISIVYNNS
jgi:CAP-Gly domain-containing linker protein 1